MLVGAVEAGAATTAPPWPDVRRLLVAAVVLGLMVVAPAGAASAHAVLRASEPLDRQVMPQAPERVLLRFSESVAVSASSVRVLDHHGDVVVGRGAKHVRGDDARVELRLPELGKGTYIVTWQVVSADSHPAVGALSFRVGEATDDFHVGLVFGAWAAAVFATVAALGLQGAYSSGGELTKAISGPVVGEVIRTRYGRATLVRLVLLLVITVAVLALRRSGRWPAQGLASVPAPFLVAGAMVLLGSLTWLGHAAAGRFTTAALVLDLAHLAAVSAWLGGLVMLVGFVLRRPTPGEPDQAESVALRFSPVAFAAVIVMVITGSLQSWRQLDGVGELTSTTFGRLLLVKLGLVAAMLVAATFGRRLVRDRLRAPAAALSPGPGAMARPNDRLGVLRKWVGVEVGLAVVVLSVTAALVNAVPARSVAEVPGPALPFSAELVKDGVKLSVTLEPARTGLDDLHVYVVSEAGKFAEKGRPIDALEVSGTLRLDKADTGPITVPLVENAPGHWSAFGFPIPIAGTWELEVAALVSDIDLVRVRTDVTIR